jgi:L-ascorbate metabolism protein UlaG (beta-lactamase superfamily)
MKIIYYGQSCFGIEMGGKKLLFDPFITPNDLAKDIDVEKIEADYILVSHGHQDHIADLVSIAKRTNAKVIGIWEVTAWLGKQGIENVHPMNIGGKWKFDFGTVKCVNAVHSSTFPDGSSAGNPMGFVLWMLNASMQAFLGLPGWRYLALTLLVAAGIVSYAVFGQLLGAFKLRELRGSFKRG